MNDVAFMMPLTSRAYAGVVVPIPMFPLDDVMFESDTARACDGTNIDIYM